MTQATGEKSTASKLYELQATTSDREIPKIYQGKFDPHRQPYLLLRSNKSDEIT